MTAFGYQPFDVRLTAIEDSAGRFSVGFCAQRSGHRLAFDIWADKAKVVLESAAPAALDDWPDLFHRLAEFGPAGPHMRVDLCQGGTPLQALPQVEALASPDETDAFKALLGYAAFALETSARASASPFEPMLVATVQALGTTVPREAASGDEASAAPASVAGALEAFRNVVEEYYTSPDWEHIRVQLDDVRISGVRHDMVTFKLFRTPAALGLEFRPLLETGEHPFQSFPGGDRDSFGQYYRIVMDRASGAVSMPEIETLTPPDRTLIDGLAAALAQTMKAATIGVGHLDEKTYATWIAAGAAFQAAYGASAESRPS